MHRPENAFDSAVIAEFESKYRCMHAETIEDVSDWYTAQGAGYEMLFHAGKGTGPVASVSNKLIGGFDLRVFNWGIPVHGLLVADTSTITINTALTGTREVRDVHFGNISWERNQAGIYSLEAGTRVTSSKPHSLLHLILPVKLLESRARSFFGDELNEPLRFSPVVNLLGEGAAVSGLLAYLLAQAVTAPEALKYPAVEANLHELVISTVLGTLPHNYEQMSSFKLDSTVPRSVKRAEEYMQAHADEPISVDILARHAGCSERALQNAFKTFLGTTPMAMLREIRLERAYRDMKGATGTVAEIAFRWGFSNVGRFSAQYAAKFGETPSQTRKLY